jgi:hypothetical protein
MLLMTKTRITASTERAVAAGLSVTSEGQPLVADYTGGVFGVKPAGGNANEKFVGVARAQQLTPAYDSKVEVFTVGASLLVTLSKLPLAYTSLRLRDLTAGADLPVDSTGPAAAALALLDAGTSKVHFHSTQLGHVIEFTYRYVPNAVDALNIQGNIPAGGAASLILDSVEVLEIGDIWTSEFDPTADYTDLTLSICTMAGALFTNDTPGGGKVAVPNATVLEVPSADSPFLGLRIVA